MALPRCIWRMGEGLARRGDRRRGRESGRKAKREVRPGKRERVKLLPKQHFYQMRGKGGAGFMVSI